MRTGINIRKASVVTTGFSLIVAALWLFPHFWYQKAEPGNVSYWLGERTELPGTVYNPVPISESAERLLVADRTLNGDFSAPGQRSIRVFSAKRFIEKKNEIGLFVHTPDRCWTQSGWKIEPNAPEFVEVTVHGVTIPFERRIFTHRSHRELVYFCGLVGGRPLPYRLDHNLSVALKFQSAERIDQSGAALRATNADFWARVWDSFASRRELFGPKQFIRVSTPIAGGDVAEADERLREFIPQWLAPVDFQSEKSEWQLAALKDRDETR